MGGISEESIRERAYHIWVREGHPHGRDFDHWVQAQIELEAETRGNGSAVASPAAPKRARVAKVAAPPAKPARAAAPRNAAPRAGRSKKS